MATIKTWMRKNEKNNDLMITLYEDEVKTGMERTRITRELEENLKEDDQIFHLDFLFAQNYYSDRKPQ